MEWLLTGRIEASFARIHVCRIPPSLLSMRTSPDPKGGPWSIAHATRDRMRFLFLLLLALISVQANAVLTVTLEAVNENCGNATGSVTAFVDGGVWPYTYAWSTGATTYQITGLIAGTYSVTVTDGSGTEVTQEVTLINTTTLDVLAIVDGVVQVSNAGNYACAGQCNGGFGLPESYFPGAVQPLTFDPAPFYHEPGMGATFTGYCAGEHPVVTVTDGSGCAGTFTFSAIPELTLEPIVVVGMNGACGDNGAITVDVGLECWCQLQLSDADEEPIGNLVDVDNGTYTFTALPAGNYHITRTHILANTGCPGTVDVTVPSLGPDCGVVGGAIFLDHDQDCVRDAQDEGLPYRVLTITPGPEFAITDAQGNYERALVFGAFTIAQPAGSIEQLCSGPGPVPFALDAASPDATVDFPDSSLVPLDVEASITAGAARPGFVLTYYMGASNNSGQLSGDLEATLSFDPSLTFLSAFPAATSTAPGNVAWSGLGGLGGFDGVSFMVNVQVPATAALGSSLEAGFSVVQPLAESSITNNSSSVSTVVTGAYDPNDKLACTSSGQSATEYLLGTDTHIDYTIRFQNTGTDTAFTVVVTDTLADDLDMGSFQQGLASHPFGVTFRPGRVVQWTFANILLPDSGTNEAASHGLVTFRIEPMEPLLPGTEITNAADIFFDFNPPVRTLAPVLTATTSTGLRAHTARNGVRVFPVPAHDRVQVRIDGTASSAPYRIHTTDGRLLRTGRLSPDGVDVSALPPGSYVLEVLMTGERCHALFIKE